MCPCNLSHVFQMLSSGNWRPVPASQGNRGRSCCKDIGDAGSQQRSAADTWLSTLPPFILKFSPRYRKFSKLNIFNFEPLLLEVGQFHGSGFLSINKTKSIIIITVGSLLKELVYLSSGCPCPWTHRHTDCYFNPLSSQDSLGFKEQKPYRDSGNISMNMVQNS